MLKKIMKKVKHNVNKYAGSGSSRRRHQHFSGSRSSSERSRHSPYQGSGRYKRKSYRSSS